MPDDDAVEVVQSMIDLSTVIQDLMLRMSDTVYSMMEEYKESGLDEINSYLATVTETEEEIRHNMSLYSQGFGKLGSMGLKIPEDMR